MSQASYPVGVEQPAIASVPAAPSLQQALAAELGLSIVPERAWTVDAIRIVRYMQLRGTCSCSLHGLSKETMACVNEVGVKLGWDIRIDQPGAKFLIVDFSDFVLPEV